jgi:hypothetical protein
MARRRVDDPERLAGREAVPARATVAVGGAVPTLTVAARSQAAARAGLARPAREGAGIGLQRRRSEVSVEVGSPASESAVGCAGSTVGVGVGSGVAFGVGLGVGCGLGVGSGAAAVGSGVGSAVGFGVGFAVGFAVGSGVGVGAVAEHLSANRTVQNILPSRPLNAPIPMTSHWSPRTFARCPGESMNICWIAAVAPSSGYVFQPMFSPASLKQYPCSCMTSKTIPPPGGMLWEK